MRSGLSIAANLLAFHGLWALTLVGATTSWWWAGPALIGLSACLQIRRSPSPRPEALVVLLGAAIGTSFDTLGVSLGMFRFLGQSRLEFLVVFLALWINFGTTLRPSLSWMWRRPAISACLGAIGGPVSYWVGARIGAIAFGDPRWMTLLWIAAQYALALPAWMFVASRRITAPAGTVPRSSATAASQ